MTDSPETVLTSLASAAILGRRIEYFLNDDPVGRYLVECADQEIEECSVKLRSISPRFWWGRRKIEKLQRRIEICESVLTWLREAVLNGQAATKIVEGYDD